MEDPNYTQLATLAQRARGYGLLRNHASDDDATRWLDEALGPGGVGEDLVNAGLDLAKPYDRALVLALDSATGYSFDTSEVRDPRDYAALVETFAAMTDSRCRLADVEILDNEDTGAPEIVFRVDGQPASYLPPKEGSAFDREGFFAALHEALANAGVAERFHAVPLTDTPGAASGYREAPAQGTQDATLTVLFATPDAWARMRAEGFVPG